MSAHQKRRTGAAPGINTTMDTFNSEVKTFWKARTISRLTLIGFLFMNLANLIALVVMAAPGWGWSHEVAGREDLAGEYYGFYGIWYACWRDVTGVGRREVCQFVSNNDFGSGILPEWWKAFQGLSVVTLIFGFFTFVAVMTYMCVINLNKNTNMILVSATLAGFAGLFSAIMFLLFAVSYTKTAWQCCEPGMVREFLDYRLYYCFNLCVIVSLLYFGTMVCCIFEAVAIKKEYRRLLAIQERYERESQWEQASIAPSIRFPQNFPPNIYKPQ